jgi:hypothetical protein
MKFKEFKLFFFAFFFWVSKLVKLILEKIYIKNFFNKNMVIKIIKQLLLIKQKTLTIPFFIFLKSLLALKGRNIKILSSLDLKNFFFVKKKIIKEKLILGITYFKKLIFGTNAFVPEFSIRYKRNKLIKTKDMKLYSYL